MNEIVTLEIDGQHGAASVEIDLGAGGRVAQIRVRGQALLIDPPIERDAASTGWGSYPMAPWAGRIRHGHFRFLGIDHELELNQQDGPGNDPDRRHAMHGTVFNRTWTVEHRATNTVTLCCPLSPPGLPTASLRDFGWTFGGMARQTIELLDGQLRCDLSIEVDHDHTNAGVPPTGAAFLGEIGWHPWFRKPRSITFHPDAMYERDDIGLPTGQLIAPPSAPWDDCFVNTAPVTLHYDGSPVPTVTISSDCDHWVIYDMPANATCVEPQSGPPDAFNVRPRLVTSTHPLRRTMNIAW